MLHWLRIWDLLQLLLRHPHTLRLMYELRGLQHHHLLLLRLQQLRHGRPLPH
jgi:hypothetical protein